MHVKRLAKLSHMSGPGRVTINATAPERGRGMHPMSFALPRPDERGISAHLTVPAPASFHHMVIGLISLQFGLFLCGSGLQRLCKWYRPVTVLNCLY